MLAIERRNEILEKLQTDRWVVVSELRSRLFPAKQKVGNHLFIKRHPTTSIDFNFYFLFLGFGAGNSSYMALNRPVKNCLLSTSSTNSISFAPS